MMIIQDLLLIQNGLLSYGGYVFNLNESLQFKPAFLGKFVTGAPMQIDVTANFYFLKS